MFCYVITGIRLQLHYLCRRSKPISVYYIAPNVLKICVVDPHCNTDPYPAFLTNKNWKNFTVRKKITIYFFLSLNEVCPSYYTGEAFSPQKRTSSTAKHDIYLL